MKLFRQFDLNAFIKAYIVGVSDWSFIHNPAPKYHHPINANIMVFCFLFFKK